MDKEQEQSITGEEEEEAADAQSGGSIDVAFERGLTTGLHIGSLSEQAVEGILNVSTGAITDVVAAATKIQAHARAASARSATGQTLQNGQAATATAADGTTVFESASETVLRLELAALKTSQLRKRAAVYAASEEALEEADDAVDTREALITLMVQHVVKAEMAARAELAPLKTSQVSGTPPHNVCTRTA
eukprot:COSAG05_NODE_217_length_13794_cov_5.734064_6_plen_191_part_00